MTEIVIILAVLCAVQALGMIAMYKTMKRPFGTPGITMRFLHPLQFRKPRLALAAVILLVFIYYICQMDASHIDKFAWGIASGFGMFFVTTGGKAIRNQYGNLAVLIFAAGLAMIAIGLHFSPEAVFEASGLEPLAPPLIGGGSGMFTTVEDES